MVAQETAKYCLCKFHEDLDIFLGQTRIPRDDRKGNPLGLRLNPLLVEEIVMVRILSILYIT